MDSLDRWQASSHPELAKCKPEELFLPPQAELYKQLHADLGDRFIQINGTILTLEKLSDFPFDYLYGPNDMEFWRLVVQNFFEIVIIKLHGLVNDTGQNVHSIKLFKNQIMKWTWHDPQKHALFKQTLQERKFDQQTRSTAKRIREIRNNRLAHRLLDSQNGLPKQLLTGLSLGDLRQLFYAAHTLFGAISFGSTYCTLAGDLIPGTIGGQPKRSCLDKVLDAVLRDSDLVKQPELRTAYWNFERQYLPPEEIEIMNRMRQRIGLPEA